MTIDKIEPYLFSIKFNWIITKITLTGLYNLVTYVDSWSVSGCLYTRWNMAPVSAITPRGANICNCYINNTLLKIRHSHWSILRHWILIYDMNLLKYPLNIVSMDSQYVILLFSYNTESSTERTLQTVQLTFCILT